VSRPIPSKHKRSNWDSPIQAPSPRDLVVDARNERSNATSEHVTARDTERRPHAVGDEQRTDVVMLSSTFPRDERDVCGRFLADLVHALRLRIALVLPDDPRTRSAPIPPGTTRELFGNHGLFGGDGALANLRGGRCGRLGATLTLARMLAASLRAARHSPTIWTHWAVPAGVAGALCSRLLGVRHVLSLHGGDVWWLENARTGRIVARFLARNAHAILAPTERLAQRFAEVSGRRPEVLGTGVPDLSPAEDAPASSGPPRAGTLCRLAPGKGLRGLVSAWERTDAELELAGDGSLALELEALAAPRSSVRLAGPLLGEAKASWLRSLDVFVAPHGTTPWGQQEGLPVSVLEALSAARPVVAYEGTCPGGPLVHGENALLAPDGRPDLLMDHVRHLLRDASLRQRLGRGARAAARPHLHAQVVPRWEALLAPDAPSNASR
jgi:glycosyltransferase involved in cell wall biosynthesis